MKKGWLLVIGLVLLTGLVLSGCASESNANAATEQRLYSAESIGSFSAGDGSLQSGVWVTGTGIVTVVPDIANLVLGVEAQSATVQEAQDTAATAMADLMAALEANGIAEKDIQTQWYSIYPVTKWIDDYKEQVTVGYMVSNTVTVKIRDVSKAGSIIDAVTEAAGDYTRISGISFTVDDPDPYYVQAREKAIQAAMTKAAQMASVANVTLGNVTYIGESGGYVPPVIYQSRDVSYAGGEVSTPISTGEMEISITVQMGFAIQ